MEVRYRYNTLDKLHEYQISNRIDIFHQWVWFYLGQKIKELKNESWLPYLQEPQKILIKEKDRINFNAEQIADIIAKAIKKHRKVRRNYNGRNKKI